MIPGVLAVMFELEPRRKDWHVSAYVQGQEVKVELDWEWAWELRYHPIYNTKKILQMRKKIPLL